MPSTQAYSVSWTVTIQPEGDVSQDVAEITAIREDDVNSATVVLDTSERPHALEEQKDITISVTDGNETWEFTGTTDAVKDDPERPTVTVDARSTSGQLDDGTAAGSYSKANLFRVIEGIVDEEPGKISGITYDPASDESDYGTLANATNFGSISLAHYPRFGVSSDTFTDGETSTDGQEAEIRINSYVNDTNTFYTLTIEGEDENGDLVEATLDLPPKEDSESISDVFGSETVKLALDGGQELWTSVNSISTDIPTLTPGGDPAYGVGMTADLFNYIKTDWAFPLQNTTSTREAIQAVISYLSGKDEGNDWNYLVNDSNELVVRPESEAAAPTTHVFREGDNVIKPVAQRDLDGVRNMIKVTGAGPIKRWVWAYNGQFYIDPNNPFKENSFGDVDYPDGAVVWDQSPLGGQNDIDQINLRAESLESDSITSHFQAIQIAQKALNQYYRTPVSGKAPVQGVKDVKVGDKAEIYYPSRGIPAKVVDNVYQVKKVELSVAPEAAKTTVEFGTKDPNLADMIQSGGSPGRTDISQDIRSLSSSNRDEGPESFPVVGTVTADEGGGRFTVQGENGETYENVRVI